MKWMSCYLEAKVSLLVASFFSLKTMPLRALLSTSNYIISFGNYSIPKIVMWQSTWRAVNLYCSVLLLFFLNTELTSVCWRFTLSIGTMDVVCTGNADNKTLVYLGTKALTQPSTGHGDSLGQEKCRDIRLAHTQTSTVSKHAHQTGPYPIWNEVKFIDRDPHWYTCTVKEAIHIRLHPNNINRNSGIEIPEAWMPTIKKHNNRKMVQQRTAKGTATRQNNGTMGGSKCTNHSWPSWYKWCCIISWPHRMKKTSSKLSKHLHLLHLPW